MVYPRYEIGSKLLLFTPRKLDAGFKLVPKSVTLNGIMAVISLNSAGLGASYIKLFEVRPTLSATYM